MQLGITDQMPQNTHLFWDQLLRTHYVSSLIRRPFPHLNVASLPWRVESPVDDLTLWYPFCKRPFILGSFFLNLKDTPYLFSTFFANALCGQIMPRLDVCRIIGGKMSIQELGSFQWWHFRYGMPWPQLLIVLSSLNVGHHIKIQLFNKTFHIELMIPVISYDVTFCPPPLISHYTGGGGDHW